MNLKKLRRNQVRTFWITLVQLNLQVRGSLKKTMSAKDNESFNNIFTNTITATTLSPMLNNMGADKGINTRSLCPREHMDKLSEYISNT